MFILFSNTYNSLILITKTYIFILSKSVYFKKVCLYTRKQSLSYWKPWQWSGCLRVAVSWPQRDPQVSALAMARKLLVAVAVATFSAFLTFFWQRNIRSYKLIYLGRERGNVVRGVVRLWGEYWWASLWRTFGVTSFPCQALQTHMIINLNAYS